MRQSFSLIAIVFFLFLSSCRDESIDTQFFGSIAGTVISEETLEPMVNVEITTSPSSEVLFTDSLGNFLFEHIATGDYVLRTELEGFTRESVNVTVEPGSETNVTLRISVNANENQAPEFLTTFAPSHGSVDLKTQISLSWEADDAEEDELQYELKLYETELVNEVLHVSDLQENSYELTDLKYNTTYFWQVLVYDEYNTIVESSVLQFKTQAAPEHRFLFARTIQGQTKIMCSDLQNDPVKLSIGNANYWRPKLNPGRNKVAFISSQNIENQIFIMNLDGSELTQVTNVPIVGTDPLKLNYCWSPDGSQLLYMHLDKLYKINIDGTGLTLFAISQNGYFFNEVDWNAQTNKVIALTTGTNPYENEIYLIDQDGTTDLIVEDLDGTIESPSFSITGEDILFTHDISNFENINGRQLDARIFLYNLDSQNLVDVSIEKTAGMNDLEPRFSPDGSQVIFTYTNNDGVSQKDIYIMDLDGGSRQLLIADGEMANWQ